MSQSEQPETPSQTLARRIVERLLAEHLIAPRMASEIETKLADGKMNQQDWRLPVEMSSEEHT